jgi:DNA-binding NtrC family response regulator
MSPSPTLSDRVEIERQRRVAPLRPYLFLVLEADRPVAQGARYALADLDAITIGRGATRSALRSGDGQGNRLTLTVPDPRVSATHAQLRRVSGRWVIEDAHSKNGMMVNGAVVERADLADGDLIELGHTFWLYRGALPGPADTATIVDASQLTSLAPGLGTLLPALSSRFQKIEQIARSTEAVLVVGESGTGKELLSRAVHLLSQRPGPLVAMNCGALPENLIETELFGHRKGSFTSAAEDRPGLVRSAERGTLFLDEVGDLPLPAQARFLRVLQEHEVQAVGATRPIKVDFRLVAATHRDLKDLVARGRFRADLLARIAGFMFELPPLRERMEDLGLFIGALLRRSTAEHAFELRFTSDAARALFRHSWPLNVRELEKCLATTAVLAGEEPAELEHLPAAVRSAAGVQPPSSADAPAPESDRRRARRDELTALLAEHGGNVSAVARALGKPRTQVQRWIKRFGLDAEGFRH